MDAYEIWTEYDDFEYALMNIVNTTIDDAEVDLE